MRAVGARMPQDCGFSLADPGELDGMHMVSLLDDPVIHPHRQACAMLMISCMTSRWSKHCLVLLDHCKGKQVLQHTLRGAKQWQAYTPGLIWQVPSPGAGDTQRKQQGPGTVSITPT